MPPNVAEERIAAVGEYGDCDVKARKQASKPSSWYVKEK